MAENPPLLAFGMANYRSFGPDGFVVRTSKRINVFVGKNNCGKSNVLRSLTILRQATSVNAGINIDELADHHRRGATPPSAIVTIPAEKFFTEGELPSNPGFLAQYKQDAGDEITIRWKLGSSEIEPPHPFGGLSEGYLKGLFEKAMSGRLSIRNGTKEQYLQELTAGLITLGGRALQGLKGLLVVPDFRQIAAKPNPDSHSQMFDSQGVIARLREMQHPRLGRENERDVFDTIERFLCGLLGTTIRMEVPVGKDEIIINMHGNRLPLESYGTGIHQLVILCTALSIYDGLTFAIEEPEVHLHPDLQRKFLQFIAEQTNNTYYITTHSNVFLDTRFDVSVYHVQFDGKTSSVTHLETSARSRDVLTDMGYKASDLLQANCVIWVEGPSDRIYLNMWLGFVASDLVEGIHYSVAFYGGKVLSHFTAGDNPVDDLVQVLHINRHAIFIVDRDGDDETVRLNDTKQRIQRELGPAGCWVTQGREIENYLPEALVRRALEKQYPAASTLSFTANHSIDEVLKAMVNGPKTYNKVAFARLFCEQMTESDLDHLDLRSRLNEVVQLIRQWNLADVLTGSEGPRTS